MRQATEILMPATHLEILHDSNDNSVLSRTENEPGKLTTYSRSSPFFAYLTVPLRSINRDEGKGASIVPFNVTSELTQQTSNYATSSDMLALERRLEFSVTEPTVLGVALKLIRRNSKIEFKLDRLRELKDRVQAKD